MRAISINCPMCGGRYNGKITGRYLICEFCDSRFALDDEEMNALGLGAQPSNDYEDYDDSEDYGDDEYVGMNLMDIVSAECEDLLCRVDRGNFESSQKIINGLGVGGDEVYLIHDDTLFKSGKNGFAITSSGLYCRELGDRTAHFMGWEDLANSRYAAEIEDSYIRVDGTSVAYYTEGDDDKEQLENLYQRLQYFAAREYGVSQ